MKIACSSATFARELASGALTQLDWLDLCANELEVDGVVFDVDHFPRRDAEYLAQLKKVATDLGLTIAAVAANDAFGAEGTWQLEAALALGAPLVVVRAPRASDDPLAWGRFTDDLQARARDAKRLGVTLALRSAGATLCPTSAELRRVAKDVDSAWLRFAFDADAAPDADDGRVLARSAIAIVKPADLASFATAGDRAARLAIERFARFRGFVVLEGSATAEPATYHHAVARFAAARALALSREDRVEK